LQGDPGPAPDRARRIVRGIGWLSVQGVVTSFLGFVLLGALLRLLPSTSYGAYSSLQVSVGIGATVATFGIGSAVVRFLAPSASSEAGPGWGAAKAAVVMNATLAGGVSAALAAAAPYLSDYFLKSPSWAWVFYLGALWLFSSSVAGVLTGVLQAARRYPLMAKLTLSSRLAGVGVAVAGLLASRSLAVAVLSWALYYGAMAGFVLLKFWRPLTSADARPHYRPVLRYAAPLAVASIVGAVASNADIVVVGGYLPPASLAVYNATVVISSLVSALFVGPLTTALFAETSFSAASPSEVARGTALALRFTALTVLPASFFAAAVAAQLFGLFSGGGVYSAGVPFLLLITLFYSFTAVQSSAVFVLQGVGKVREVLAVGVAAAGTDIALSVSLVPRLGLAGAADSRVTVMVVGCALSLYFLRGYLPRVNYPFLGKALVASAVPALAVYLLSALVSDRVLTLVPYAAVGGAAFVACARGLRLLSDEDRAYLGHLLPEGLRWVSRLL
jgi:O-antigen/teichoic acid export membrane protein